MSMKMWKLLAEMRQMDPRDKWHELPSVENIITRCKYWKESYTEVIFVPPFEKLPTELTRLRDYLKDVIEMLEGPHIYKVERKYGRVRGYAWPEYSIRFLDLIQEMALELKFSPEDRSLVAQKLSGVLSALQEFIEDLEH